MDQFVQSDRRGKLGKETTIGPEVKMRVTFFLITFLLREGRMCDLCQILETYLKIILSIQDASKVSYHLKNAYEIRKIIVLECDI